jgi:hypothetical protein
MTRSDIAYTLVYLSCVQANPNQTHLDAVNELMRYLKKTASMRQRFDCSNPSEQSVYMACDANWDMESWAGGHQCAWCCMDILGQENQIGYAFVHCFRVSFR